MYGRVQSDVIQRNYWRIIVKLLSKTLLVVATLALAFSTAFAQDEITVAYFLGWATPNQIAQVEQTFDDAMGVKVNWVSFDTGVEMSTAMQAGSVDIAYSQGATPFALAVSSGVPIKMVGMAMAYVSNNDCIVSTASGITDPADLAGETVAIPVGTMADYEFRLAMQYLGVDTSSMNIVDQAPPDGAVSLASGDVAMACGFGDPVFAMRESGDALLTQDEKFDAGITAFDIISVTEEFAENSPELVVKFLEITAQMDGAFEASLASSTLSTAWYEALSGPSGMEPDNVEAQISGFDFLSVDEQLSDTWLGGAAVDAITEMANIFDAAGEITALDDYGPTVDTSFLEQLQ